MFELALEFILVLAAGLLAAYGLRARARRKLEATPLRPNCLLTRHPLVFISAPKRSMFFQKTPPVVRGLAAHGYEVISLTQNARLQKDLNRLCAHYGRIHAFYDPAVGAALIPHSRALASQNEITLEPLDAYLDRAISLAEADFQCSH